MKNTINIFILVDVSLSFLKKYLSCLKISKNLIASEASFISGYILSLGENWKENLSKNSLAGRYLYLHNYNIWYSEHYIVYSNTVYRRLLLLDWFNHNQRFNKLLTCVLKITVYYLHEWSKYYISTSEKMMVLSL